MSHEIVPDGLYRYKPTEGEYLISNGNVYMFFLGSTGRINDINQHIQKYQPIDSNMHLFTHHRYTLSDLEFICPSKNWLEYLALETL